MTGAALGALRRALATAWPPLAAWCAAAGALLATAAATGHHPFEPRTWSRWDSGLYLDIAHRGYTAFPCPTEPGDWCGNAAWFPLFPWTIRGLHALGAPATAAAVGAAWAFGAATLVVVWVAFLGRRATWAAAAALVYAAFAPGQVFDFSAYPLSLLALATVAFLALLARGRLVAAGIAGAAAAMSYPLGLLLAPAAAVWLLADRDVPVRGRLRAVGIVSGLVALGGAVVVLVQRLETGRWNSFFLVQAKYEHVWRSPLTSLREALYAARTARPFLQLSTAPPLQTLFVAAVGACILVALAVGRERLHRAELLVAVWALLTWTLPHAETGISLYRSQAALLPMAVLVRRLPRPLVVAVAVGAVALAVPMAELFLTNRLQ